jgi:hypothetical protein
MKFIQLISNAMQRKIMLQLGDPSHGIGAMKFMEGLNTIYMGGLFKEARGLYIFNKWFRVELMVSNFPSNLSN